MSNTMQPCEYSRGGGTGDSPHNSAKVHGNRNVPYLNRNSSKRNLNLNWYDNKWNENCRFLVRNIHGFPAHSFPESAGFFCNV